MTAIVIDLDGTLCNSAHREHHAQNKDWDAFHGALSEDEPHRDVRGLITMLAHGPELIGCTGRNERYRIETERWLTDWGIMLDRVLMRPDHDFRSDVEVKLALLEDWHEEERAMIGQDGLRLQDRVLFVLEDRDKMVEAWRNAGFNCWQVRAGAY